MLLRPSSPELCVVAPSTTTLLPWRYYVSTLEQADEGIGGTTVCITVGEPERDKRGPNGRAAADVRAS